MNAKNTHDSATILVQIEVYSRFCGYFRPVSQWNKGKKKEFRDRIDYR